jgi:flagellar motor switch protein FliG
MSSAARQAAATPTATPAVEAAPRVQATALSGIEKAALLVMYLERDTAREILRRLSDDEVKKLGMAIASVQHIPDGVIEGVVGDFIMSLQNVSLVPFTGRDFAQDVLPELVDESRRHVVAGAIRRRVGGDFEAFIKAKSPNAIAAVLRDEHPQVQAVALLRMGHENASRVLSILSEESQYDLTIRMARAERVSGALADDVEDSVRRALEDQDDPLPIGGAQTTARILGRLPREKNQTVLVRLRDEGNDLADRLQRLMVVFEDLVSLDDRAIQALLRVVERPDLVMALKGASPEMRGRFLKNLSSRAAADLQDEMDVLGNPRKTQVRTAQENITAAAQRLHDDGVIVLITGPEEED